MGNIKVFISKFVISKLRKEVAQVSFLFKKMRCGSPQKVRTRRGQP